MKNPLLVSLFILALGVAVFPQSQTNGDTYYLLPKTYVLPVVVVQNDCPIIIERFFPVADSQGKIHTEYRVRNTGTKAVKSYRIARWYSDNTGFLQYGAMPSGAKVLQPNSLIDTSVTKNFQAIDSKARNYRTMEKIAFAMIVDIEFADGSVFDAVADFEALTTHLKLFEASYGTDSFDRE